MTVNVKDLSSQKYNSINFHAVSVLTEAVAYLTAEGGIVLKTGL